MIEAMLLSLLAIPVVYLFRPPLRLLWALFGAPRIPGRRSGRYD